MGWRGIMEQWRGKQGYGSKLSFQHFIGIFISCDCSASSSVNTARHLVSVWGHKKNSKLPGASVLDSFCDIYCDFSLLGSIVLFEKEVNMYFFTKTIHQQSVPCAFIQLAWWIGWKLNICGLLNASMTRHRLQWCPVECTVVYRRMQRRNLMSVTLSTSIWHH